MPVLVKRKPGAKIVNLGVFALGGAIDEGEARGGLTTLVARTALKGTERRTATQIAEDGELLGGSIGLSVGAESFGWTLSVPVQHTAAALDLLADVAQNPTFPDDAFETERAVALSDVAMMRDDMYRYPLRLALRAAFAGHPYGSPVIGTEESLRTLDAGMAREWHRTRLLEAPLVVAIVGDVDADDAAAIAARDFAQLRMREHEPIPGPSWPTEAVANAEPREKAQTALVLAFPSPARSDDDRFAAHLLAGVASGLGGRFFDELRDRQSLAYTVHAYASERALAGTFVSYIATSPELEETARHGLLAEFAKLRETPVSDEELERAKTYAIGTHAIQQESGSAVLADIVEAWLFGRGPAELEEHDARVLAVTPERMLEVAGRYFDESRRVEGIVRGTGRTV